MMLLCDHCKNQKNNMIARYYVGQIKCYEYDNLEFPKNIDRKWFHSTIDLCDNCASKFDNDIKWLLYCNRKGKTSKEIFNEHN